MRPFGLLGGIVLWLLAGLSVSAVSPDVWFTRTSPTSNQLNGVTYGGGLYVGAGSKGTILVSSNANDWMTRTSGTSATFHCAGPRYIPYILGGELGSLISLSYDGLVWTNVVFTAGRERIYGV